MAKKYMCTNILYQVTQWVGGNLLTCIPVGVWVGKRVSEDSGVPPADEEAFA